MKNLIKNPRFWTGVIVVVVIITIIIQSKNRENQKSNTENNQKTEQQEPAKTTISSPNVWEGVLKTSDNAIKGNLMLLTSEKKIYIKTNRDFSLLINKKVAVTYEGTMDSFRLGDIVENRE